MNKNFVYCKVNKNIKYEPYKQYSAAETKTSI